MLASSIESILPRIRYLDSSSSQSGRPRTSRGKSLDSGRSMLSTTRESLKRGCEGESRTTQPCNSTNKTQKQDTAHNRKDSTSKEHRKGADLRHWMRFWLPASS
eukprot:3467028-Rhodomonas_salina.1